MTIGVALPDSGPTGVNAVDHFVSRATQAYSAGVGAVWFSQRFDHDRDGGRRHTVVTAEFIAPTITDAAGAAGRGAPRIAAAIPIVVTDNRAQVHELARREMDFYNAIPSYRAVLDREGVDHPVDLAIIGDEDYVTGELERYRAAGATDIIATQTALHTDDDRLRTWRLLGALQSGW